MSEIRVRVTADNITDYVRPTLDVGLPTIPPHSWPTTDAQATLMTMNLEGADRWFPKVTENSGSRLRAAD